MAHGQKNNSAFARAVERNATSGHGRRLGGKTAARRGNMGVSLSMRDLPSRNFMPATRSPAALRDDAIMLQPPATYKRRSNMGYWRARLGRVCRRRGGGRAHCTPPLVLPDRLRGSCRTIIRPLANFEHVPRRGDLSSRRRHAMVNARQRACIRRATIFFCCAA